MNGLHIQRLCDFDGVLKFPTLKPVWQTLRLLLDGGLLVFVRSCMGCSRERNAVRKNMLKSRGKPCFNNMSPIAWPCADPPSKRAKMAAGPAAKAVASAVGAGVLS